MSSQIFFRRLLDACIFEELALRLTSQDKIDEASRLFPYANPRILMSSVMIYKFPDYHSISITSPIFESAKHVCMKGLDDTLKESDYKTFQELFFDWIKRDKDVMILELNKAQEELRKTTEHETIEWADRETSKEGITAQVKLIEDSKLVLEKSHETLFGSPPK